MNGRNLYALSCRLSYSTTTAVLPRLRQRKAVQQVEQIPNTSSITEAPLPHVMALPVCRRTPRSGLSAAASYAFFDTGITPLCTAVAHFTLTLTLAVNIHIHISSFITMVSEKKWK